MFFPATTTALVIDDSLTVRQSVRGILAQLGITRAESASSIPEARRKLNAGRVDIVLCDYHYGAGANGQEFLEELRHTGTLPLSTIFIMITAEASYEKVVSVAEVAPDDYLLKPFTSAQLAARMNKSWARKKLLEPVYKAIERGAPAEAVDLCYDLIRQNTPHQNDIIRLVAQLLTELQRYDEAAAIYQKMLANKLVPWAKLGLAKIYHLEGRGEEAEEMMMELLAESQNYVDAYDQLAQHYMLTERESEALEVLEQALKVTPCNVHRLQSAGQVAYRMGNMEAARKYLEKAVTHGGNSSVLDLRSMFYLGVSLLKEGKAKEAEQMRLMMSQAVEKNPTFENQNLLTLLEGADHVAMGRLEVAESRLREVAINIGEPVIDITLGSDLLSVVTLLPEGTACVEAWVREASRRFANSRLSIEKLEVAVRSHPAMVAAVHEEAQHINQVANQGMMLVVQQKVLPAADHLFQHARETRNSRLLLAASNACVRAWKQSKEVRFVDAAEEAFDLLVRQPHDQRSIEQLRQEIESARKEADSLSPSEGHADAA